jgi:hypothetical protein
MGFACWPITKCEHTLFINNVFVSRKGIIAFVSRKGLKTAKANGVTIPSSPLQQADQVIQ